MAVRWRGVRAMLGVCSVAVVVRNGTSVALVVLLGGGSLVVRLGGNLVKGMVLGRYVRARYGRAHVRQVRQASEDGLGAGVDGHLERVRVACARLGRARLERAHADRALGLVLVCETTRGRAPRGERIAAGFYGLDRLLEREFGLEVDELTRELLGAARLFRGGLGWGL